MTNSTSNRGPILFTVPHPEMDERTWPPEVFRPEEAVCPGCTSALVTYKTSAGRFVVTLAGTKELKAVQLTCPNPDCPERYWDRVVQDYRPRVFTSTHIRWFVFPKKKFGMDVVLEIGHRAFERHQTGKEIQAGLKEGFELEISERSVYRYKDLFEDLCAGIIHEHAPEIAQKLHAQPYFVLCFDAIQLHRAHQLYRAVDHLSGLCLSTMVVDEGNKERLIQWRQKLFERFGIPDAIVSDGEPALHLNPTLEPRVPHQHCWYHVEKNVWKVLLEDWRKIAHQFFTQTAYKAKIKHLLQTLPTARRDDWPPHGRHLRVLLELLVDDPPQGSGFEDPMAVRLQQLREARTLVAQWVRAIQGQKGRYSVDDALFETYRTLKGQLPPRDRTNYLSLEIFRRDIYFQVLIQLKELLDRIGTSRLFPKLLTSYKSRFNEFDTLRSWLLEAQVRRNQASEWYDATPQTASETQLVQLLHQTTARATQELAKIPKHYRAWYWKHGEPDLPLCTKASQVLQRIVDRWTKKGQVISAYQKAVNILTKQWDYLLVFFEQVAIPVSNQALETDNGQLKQLWRRTSGCQDRPYMLTYHGNGTSMVRNGYRGAQGPSPLAILGFSPELIQFWVVTCAVETVAQVQREKSYYREMRRLKLRAKRQPLSQIFQHTHNDWLTWSTERLSQYLEEKGT